MRLGAHYSRCASTPAPALHSSLFESNCKIFWVYLLGRYKWGIFRCSTTRPRDRELVMALVDIFPGIYSHWLTDQIKQSNLIEATDDASLSGWLASHQCRHISTYYSILIDCLTEWSKSSWMKQSFHIKISAYFRYHLALTAWLPWSEYTVHKSAL